MAKAKVVNLINNRYSGTMDKDTCDVLEGIIELDRYNGSYQDLKHCIKNLSDRDVDTLISDFENYGMSITSIEKPDGTLRDEQTLGVAFLYTSRRCILGDSVGLGKTVQTAGAMNKLRDAYNSEGYSFRYLALTEKNLANQFRKEMIKFTGEYTYLIPNSGKDELDKFIELHPYKEQLEHNIVGTYNILSSPVFIQWLEQSKTQGYGFPFNALIIDESSVLGGEAKTLINGYKAISGYFDIIIFLNATPFETKLNIFYNQLNLLDPKFLPTKEKFTKEYCVMDYRGMFPKPSGKYKNADKFKQLIGYRYFARTREQKGAIQSDCDGRILISPLSKIQKKWLDRTQMKRIIYDCPSYLDETIDFNEENVPKLTSLRELLEKECPKEDTVIISVYFKEAQKHLSEWLTNQGYSNMILNGDTSHTDRLKIIDDFKQNKFKILITNVQRGLNFGNCNYCIFYSFEPNPTAMIQFEGRITRDFNVIGKHIYVLCSDGLELKTLNTIVKDRAKATSLFTKTDISVIMDLLLGGGENDN